MSDFEVVSKNKKVDPCYGLETLRITKEEIEALLSGKKLYSTVNDGEYAITIETEDGKNLRLADWLNSDYVRRNLMGTKIKLSRYPEEMYCSCHKCCNCGTEFMCCNPDYCPGCGRLIEETIICDNMEMEGTDV